MNPTRSHGVRPRHPSAATSRMRVVVLSVCLALFSPLDHEAPAATGGDAPNIIFFMADDMGYGDVGVYNAESKIPTPNIDRLANEGLRFTNAHSPSSVCSPTRYGVLTGRYAWRTRLQSGIVKYFDPPLIDLSRLTLPAMMRHNGYSTAAIGKWHLGLNVPRLDGTGFLGRYDQALGDYTAPLEGGPTDYGFDYYFGRPGGRIKAFVENDQYVGEVLNTGKGWGVVGWDESAKGPIQLNKALAFIDQHHLNNASEGSDSPFFMYYAAHAPHTPFKPALDVNGIPVTGVSDAGPRGDMVVENDVVIGELVGKLEELGIDDNTLIVVTSDNGGLLWGNNHRKTFDHKSNGDWRGRKGDTFEGGHRVPFIARWGDGSSENSVIAPNTTSDEAIGLHDMMATLAALVEEDLGADAGEDSVSFLPLLQGDPILQSVRKDLIHHSSNGMFAIRQGDWKLIFGDGSGGGTRPVGTVGALPGLLYDLANDPQEKNNVWSDHPDVVESLLLLLDHYRQSGRSALRFNGDMNRDGIIDWIDWQILKPYIGFGSTLDEGDFNLDGLVDHEDFEIFSNAFHVMNPGVQLPEPTPLWGIMAAIAVALGCRSRTSWAAISHR